MTLAKKQGVMQRDIPPHTSSPGGTHIDQYKRLALNEGITSMSWKPQKTCVSPLLDGCELMATPAPMMSIVGTSPAQELK